MPSIKMAGHVSVFSSIRALWSTMFGVGMYFIPRIFAQSGILYGCLQLISVGFISFLSILVLFLISAEMTRKQKIVKEKDFPMNIFSITVQDKFKQELKVSKLSYTGLGSHVNKYLGYTIDIMIILSCTSTILFFQKFASLTTSSLLGIKVVDNNVIFVNYYFHVISYGIIIWAVGQFKRLQSIDCLSYIGLGCVAINCLIISVLNFFIKDFAAIQKFTSGNSRNTFSLSAISTFVIANFCQSNVVEIFNNMKNKGTKNFFIVTAASTLGACGLYCLMGIAGSLLFKPNMPNEDIITILADHKSIIIKHLLDSDSVLYYVHFIVPCLAIISLLISSVYQLSAVTRSINEKKLFRNMDPFKRQLITTAIVIGSVSIINMFPSISLDLIFNIINQVMINLLSYTFPFLFLLFSCKGKIAFNLKLFRNFNSLKIIGSLIFIFGSIGFIIGVFIYEQLSSFLPVEKIFICNTTKKSFVTD